MRLAIYVTGLRLVAYWLLDALLITVRPARRVKNGVALIRLDAIGDFILWIDSAKEYKRLYAGQRIVLIANAAWADWATNLPYWDEVWSLDTRMFNRNLRYRAKMLFKIRRAGFEKIIHSTYSRAFHGDSLVRASAAVQRIGSEGDESNISATAKAVSNRWYTQLISASTQSMMELERNAEFIRNSSGSPYEADMPRLPKSVVNVKHGTSSNDYFVLFPGASWTGKQWPLEKFVELASRLHAKVGWTVVLCGGPNDVMLCQKIGNKLTVPFVNWAGKTSLPELAGLISKARLLISNDTSAIHIAAAMTIPAVCILGGGHYGRFLPYPAELPGIKPLVADHQMPCFNCNWVCSKKHDPIGPVPCIDKVSVQSVFALASSLIDHSFRDY